MDLRQKVQEQIYLQSGCALIRFKAKKQNSEWVDLEKLYFVMQSIQDLCTFMRADLRSFGYELFRDFQIFNGISWARINISGQGVHENTYHINEDSDREVKFEVAIS
jgi:hypothetical protein